MVYWGYNPFTNHLPTSWDIQVSSVEKTMPSIFLSKGCLCGTTLLLQLAPFLWWVYRTWFLGRAYIKSNAPPTKMSQFCWGFEMFHQTLRHPRHPRRSVGLSIISMVFVASLFRIIQIYTKRKRTARTVAPSQKDGNPPSNSHFLGVRAVCFWEGEGCSCNVVIQVIKHITTKWYFIMV